MYICTCGFQEIYFKPIIVKKMQKAKVEDLWIFCRTVTHYKFYFAFKLLQFTLDLLQPMKL